MSDPNRSKSASLSLTVFMTIAAFAGTFAATRWWHSSEDPHAGEQCANPQAEDRSSPADVPQPAQQDAPPGMVWISGGEFTMGTDDDEAWPDEQPAHRVRVDGFWMDRTEVTNTQFQKFVDATGYITTAERKPDWEELKQQLPAGKPFTWGDVRGECGQHANIWEGSFPNQNTAEDDYVRTAPAGSFQPNGYGLYDMAGNVWEWCSDWYRRDVYRRRAATGTVENPRGPEDSFDPTRPPQAQRSQRGGSFLCNDSYCTRYRPSARRGCTPDTGMSHVGFRCVMPPAMRKQHAKTSHNTTKGAD